MREDVFKKYYAAMVKIITYKETDKDGNVRKCTVSVDEAEKHPDKYKIYEYKHPALEGHKLAYDPEIVKKFTNTFKKLCGILPQEKLGSLYEIYQSDLVNAEPNTKQEGKEMILAETFFAMASECNVMIHVGQSSHNPYTIKGPINGVIPTTYKEDTSLEMV